MENGGLWSPSQALKQGGLAPATFWPVLPGRRGLVMSSSFLRLLSQAHDIHDVRRPPEERSGRKVSHSIHQACVRHLQCMRHRLDSGRQTEKVSAFEMLGIRGGGGSRVHTRQSQGPPFSGGSGALGEAHPLSVSAVSVPGWSPEPGAS